jgi:TM2 domain-containing membrane protein YozV
MIFGCGHFYAGRWRAGLAYLFGSWAAVILLAAFTPTGVYAFAWLGMLIWTPIAAARAVRRRNALT